jgi:hypothetical protein
MTTSGTTAFTVTRDDIIAAALRSCGVVAEGASPTTEQVTNSAFALNLLLKNFAIQGWLLWVYSSVTIPLVANQVSYTIGPSGANVTANRPIRLARGYIRDSNGYDTPLRLLTQDEYDRLTPKAANSSIPNSIYYDAQIGTATVVGNGTLYIWPPSADATRTIILTDQRHIQDVSSSTQNFDLPQEWFLPLKWQLASEIGPDYGVTERQQQRIDQKAEFYLNKVADFSTAEEPAVFFTHDSTGR